MTSQPFRTSPRAAFAAFGLGAVLIAGAVPPAMAEGPQLLGSTKAWSAFAYTTEDNQRACYAASAPMKFSSKPADRKPLGLIVSHFPDAKARDQVSVALGFKADKTGALIKIGEEKFRLDLVEGERAWARKSETDKALIRAMQKGDRLIVEAVSPKGDRIADEYDLSGFSKSYRAIGQACGG